MSSPASDTLRGMKNARLLVLALLALLGPVALVSCSSDTDAPAATAAVRPVDPAETQRLVDDGAEVIDVRTPEEFATGHLAGAENIDVQAANFHERVDGLDRDGTYVLYCRSGARAGAAGEMMLEMGFTDVANAGGFETLASAGLPTE